MDYNFAEEIGKADGSEIELLLKLMLQRYSILYPDWEIHIVSLQKSGDKNKQLEKMIRLLHGMKKPAPDPGIF